MYFIVEVRAKDGWVFEDVSPTHLVAYCTAMFLINRGAIVLSWTRVSNGGTFRHVGTEGLHI